MEPPPSPSTSPNPNPNPNPNPITFVQADAQSFKQVVQFLTGNSPSQNHNLPPPKNPNPNPIKKPAFKLYKRRSSSKNLKMISPLLPSAAAAASAAGSRPEILSPSILDFPKLALSPVTPLNPDRLSPISPEDRAIAEKGFYLHPSPRDTEPPKLLPLFTMKSPRMGGPSAGEPRERG